MLGEKELIWVVPRAKRLLLVTRANDYIRTWPSRCVRPNNVDKWYPCVTLSDVWNTMCVCRNNDLMWRTHTFVQYCFVVTTLYHIYCHSPRAYEAHRSLSAVFPHVRSRAWLRRMYWQPFYCCFPGCVSWCVIWGWSRVGIYWYDVSEVDRAGPLFLGPGRCNIWNADAGPRASDMRCACVFFLPLDIQHTQCPCWFFILER